MRVRPRSEPPGSRNSPDSIRSKPASRSRVEGNGRIEFGNLGQIQAENLPDSLALSRHGGKQPRDGTIAGAQIDNHRRWEQTICNAGPVAGHGIVVAMLESAFTKRGLGTLAPVFTPLSGVVGPFCGNRLGQHRVATATRGLQQHSYDPPGRRFA